MGRLLGLLAVLNVVMLVAGLSLEQVRGKPARLVDFNADKVRLLEPMARQETPPAKPAEPTQREEATARPVTRCLTWPELDAALFAEIESRLDHAGIDRASYDIRLAKRLGWWVYLPPFADAAAMQAAIDEARQKGVKDIAAVRGGELRHAVSLGTFPSLAQARARAEQLRALGLRNIALGPRLNAGSASLAVAESVAEARLTGLGEGWPRAPVACAAE